MDYNFYKQCVVCLCVLLPYVLDKAMAGLCGKCQYYNVDIEQCESCVFACTPARNHCRRVCPGKYYLTTGTASLLIKLTK